MPTTATGKIIRSGLGHAADLLSGCSSSAFSTGFSPVFGTGGACTTREKLSLKPETSTPEQPGEGRLALGPVRKPGLPLSSCIRLFFRPRLHARCCCVKMWEQRIYRFGGGEKRGEENSLPYPATRGQTSSFEVASAGVFCRFSTCGGHSCLPACWLPSRLSVPSAAQMRMLEARVIFQAVAQ